MRGRCWIVGCVDGVNVRREFGQRSAKLVETAAVDRRHLSGDDRTTARLKQRLERHGGEAGGRGRLPARSSVARRTAREASAAYPSAPTASAYSWVTGAPPT